MSGSTSDLNRVDKNELVALLELAESLSGFDNFDTIAKSISEKVARMFRADNVNLIMVNPLTNQTRKTVFHEHEHTDLTFHKAVVLLNGWIFKHEQSYLIKNARKDSLFENTPLEKTIDGSIIGVPLRISGKLIGCLVLSRLKGAYEETDLYLLEKLAALISPYLLDVNNLQKYFQKSLPEATLLAKYEKLGMIGKSPSFISLLKAIDAAANTDVRVLLEGQSGTGKELIAKAIHKLSTRNDQPFLAVDCGAIPANLIESELFGHVRGAFTGANFTRTGLLAEANNGTIFLDEISSMPIEVQSKLLRVLQENEIKPVGSNKTRSIDVRVIAASSISLHQLIHEQKFREDLYYRLYVYPINIPALGERHEDIAHLANHFLKQIVAKQKKSAKQFQPDLLKYMNARDWPGNIRELENFVERIVTLAPKNTRKISASILPADLQEEFRNLKTAKGVTSESVTLNDRIADVEEEMIRNAMVRFEWNQSRAARALGISEYVIRYKLSKLGIEKPES